MGGVEKQNLQPVPPMTQTPQLEQIITVPRQTVS